MVEKKSGFTNTNPYVDIRCSNGLDCPATYENQIHYKDTQHITLIFFSVYSIFGVESASIFPSLRFGKQRTFPGAQL